MRLHQVLTGAANVTEESVAVGHGNVSGYPFTVYGSGFEVVLLDSHFNRVQIISNHGGAISSIVKCIACSSNGKQQKQNEQFLSDKRAVAASFGEKVFIYEPQMIQNVSSEVKIPFQWKKIAVLSSGSEVRKLCWDQEGKRLLVGSDSLHIWRQESTLVNVNDEEHDSEMWGCVWHRKLAAPASFLEFSPDGHYFASAGQNDPMIKIWFRAPKAHGTPSSSRYQRQQSGHSSLLEEKYNFIYILHPGPIQYFSWRKTGKYMPNSCVPNVLLTSCVDNVCRLWSETVKYKPSHHNLTTERPQSNFASGNKSNTEPYADEKFHFHQRYHLVSMFHFHLAAVINPSSDIALLSTIPISSIFGRSFQLEWLNNKEVQLTTAVEAMFASVKIQTENEESSREESEVDTDPYLLVDGIDGELSFREESLTDSDKILNRTLEEDEADIDLSEEPNSSTSTKSQLPEIETPVVNSEIIKHHITKTSESELINLLHEWCSSSDTLFCIHPVDGSLLIWVIDHLDDFKGAYYRQVQVSFASRIPSTFSKADASSLCWTHSFHYTQPVRKTLSSHTEPDSFFMKHAAKYTTKRGKISKRTDNTENLSLLQVSYLVSAHADGSLNLWLVTFSDSLSFTGIASITNITRSCGPRFETTRLVSHPKLPLIIGTSRRPQSSLSNKSCTKDRSHVQNINHVESELILWSSTNVSPLSEFKGIIEMARISSSNVNEFQNISWVPTIFHHSLISITTDSVELIPDISCASFVASSDSGLYLYQVLLDAKSFLSSLSIQHSSSSGLTSKNQMLSEYIESEQSGNQSACIMKICVLEDSFLVRNIDFLKVYSEKSLFSDASDSVSNDSHNFYACAVSFKDRDHPYLYIWKIEVLSNEKFNTSQDSPKSVYSDLASPQTPVPLKFSHCLKQKLVYKNELQLNSKIKMISSAVDVLSSNLNPSCPVSYNFVTLNENNDLNFWNIFLEGNELDDRGTVNVESISCLPNVNSTNEEILCISSANTDKFAYLTKFDKEQYNLVIKESKSTGKFIWNTESNIPVFLKDGYEKVFKMELAWLSLENGCYVLALGLGNRVYIYYKTRAKDLKNMKQISNQFKWEILKMIHLGAGENRLQLTTISWTKYGFFLIGVENEIQVYSQWEDNREFVFKKQVGINASDNDLDSEHGVILTKNSFTQACDALKVLPQYHPDRLLQLLNLGKIRRVRAILKHLVKCVTVEDVTSTNIDLIDHSGGTRARSLTRTYSFASDYGTPTNPAEVEIKEPAVTDKKIDTIPPLTLTMLYEADLDDSGGNRKGENPFEENSKRSSSSVSYGTKEAQVLTENLSRKEMPGLTSQEQMYLLALSDTVASTTYDIEATTSNFTTKHMIERSLSTMNSGGAGYASAAATNTAEAFDDCGLKFLLLIRHHTAISQRYRNLFHEKFMLPSEYFWAFHSDCTEELLTMIPSVSRGEPTWSDLRAHGVGWWVKSNDVLRRTVEKVAKTHFQLKKDPLDCAIFYLAMKKKSLICALYRSLRDVKMAAFFNNNFEEERWRKAALKNAYALLGKQRFEHAAAFFLLGNALWDAVQVCVNRLKDIQLALIICRLYDNTFEQTHNEVLKKFVLASDSDEIYKDPFFRSMSYWILKDYDNSFKVLLLPTQQNQNDEKLDYPALFNLYHYLSKHPLLKRRHLTQHKITENDDYLKSKLEFKEKLLVLERKLIFRTAYSHMNAGLPDIAFEVLSLLPDEKEINEADIEEQSKSSKNENTSNTEDMIITGTISNDFSFGNSLFSQTTNNDSINKTSNAWNTYSSGWGAKTNQFADLDEEYEIGISISDSDSDSESEKNSVKPTEDTLNQNGDYTDNQYIEEMKDEKKDRDNKDIAALHLKYTCVIQCIIEELKALPFKCTQEKLKLKATLNSLLLHELDFLHKHCDFGRQDKHLEVDVISGNLVETDTEDYGKMHRSDTGSSGFSLDTPVNDLTLREKVEQVALHAEWLKNNQKVLTDLYEHFSMVGSDDPELPAICLELLLVLHEIEDNKVLASPLTSLSAGPSVPPLLLASMTSFALVASPNSFLRSMAQDILQTVVDLPMLPSPSNPVTRLADLEKLMFSLSSCIYHSLCGGEEDKLLASVKRGEIELVGKQNIRGKLLRLPPGSTDVSLEPTSAPNNWPGVKFFMSILTANSKDSSQNIRLLLCEAAVAVYLSNFVSACSRLSCNNLYRFILNGLSNEMWAAVFGGATKIVVPALDGLSTSTGSRNSEEPGKETKFIKTDRNRLRWNYKLIGNTAALAAGVQSDDNKKLLRHEVFISPQMSLCDYFLKKPNVASDFDYDSDNESDTDDEDDDIFGNDVNESEIEDDGLDDSILKKQQERAEKKKIFQEKLNEHYNSNSYPWLIMKLSLVKIASANISSFLSMAGLEISDLPTQSLLLYNTTKILLRWEQLLLARLETYPHLDTSLIDHSEVEENDDGVVRGGVTLQRIKTLLDPKNTPFSKLTSKSLPAKRLWHTLAQQESLRQIFLHYSFKTMPYIARDELDFDVICGKVLHKDIDAVTNFCMNKANRNFIAVSTVHEIIEYDISGSLDTDEIYDMDELPQNVEGIESNDEEEARKSSTPVVVQRRTCTGIRRMDSHPSLPYYVTGGSDGSVRMYEFIHPDQIVQFRGAGQNDRVNKIQFNPLGNKFAVVDDSGYLSMWLVANTHDTAPYMTLKCHSKFCYDFAFLGSSSLIATVGSSNDKRNVCIWDTLLPPKKTLVHSFSHKQSGAQSILYVPGQQYLISGGKRGDVCIFDIRQRRLLHTFQAHDSIIKTMALDPTEMFFVTGSVDGDIKVWGLVVHELFESFPKEHSRSTVSLRQISPGVQALRVVSGYQLFSCGGDGTLKWRILDVKNKT